MTRHQHIGILLGSVLVLAFQAKAEERKQYIDVHVHLRGTTTSGMLGNSGDRKPDGVRIPGKGPGPRVQPGMRGGAGNDSASRRDKIQTQQENLNIAAEKLIKQMDKFGVQQALVVVVPGPISNEFEESSLRKVVMDHRERLKLLAGGAVLSPYLQKIKPEDVTDDNRKQFRKAAEQLLKDGAIGFGEMVSYHLSMADHHSFQYAAPDHPLYMLLADIAAENNVAIDIHMEAIVTSRPLPENLKRASSKNPSSLEPTIPAFERLLEHNRKARIVWQHIGWDNTGDMTSELVGRLLSKHPNLNIAIRVEERSLQVGGGPKMPNRLVDENGKIKAEWLGVIEKHSDRITIGTDEFFFPVESEQRPNQSFDGTWSLLDQLPKQLAREIGSNNPRRIYNLK